MEIMEKITVGACREETMTVGVHHTAQALGSGSLPVLGTPAMTALMEKAATNLAQELLPEGWTSVGTALNIEHLAATPVGAAVRAMATVEAREDASAIKSKPLTTPGLSAAAPMTASRWKRKNFWRKRRTN